MRHPNLHRQDLSLDERWLRWGTRRYFLPCRPVALGENQPFPSFTALSPYDKNCCLLDMNCLVSKYQYWYTAKSILFGPPKFSIIKFLNKHSLFSYMSLERLEDLVLISVPFFFKIWFMSVKLLPMFHLYLQYIYILEWVSAICRILWFRILPP